MSFNVNDLTGYYSKTMAFLVKNRMRSTRYLIGMVVFLMLFTAPVIEPDAFWGILFDWIGYTFIVLACFGRTFSGVFIGGTKNEKLSTEGPFSVVRNPLYVFSFFGVLGAGFLTNQFGLFILLMGIFFIYYPEVVKHEEKFLSKKFGQEYANYCRDVPRWFPKQWNMPLPETMTVYPGRLLKTMQDASLFFLMFPFVETVEALHAAHWLPVLFHLF